MYVMHDRSSSAATMSSGAYTFGMFITDSAASIPVAALLNASSGLRSFMSTVSGTSAFTSAHTARPSAHDVVKFFTSYSGILDRTHSSSAFLALSFRPFSIWYRRMIVQIRPRISFRFPSTMSSAPMPTSRRPSCFKKFSTKFRFSSFWLIILGRLL